MDIKNFFLKKDVYNLQDIINNPSSYIGGFNNEHMVNFIQNNKAKYIEDSFLLLEGSIIFKEGYKEIGGIPIFDDLATLYAYYMNIVEELLLEGREKSRFYYPNQPIEVSWEKIKNSKIKISIDDQKKKQQLISDTDTLLKLIVSHADGFFTLLINELDLTGYQYEIDRIEKFKRALKR
ncbi:hypothetical protein [Bacillus manliponensis]|uniref:hypothetical protein n=1 Tax=Bacillus manliponensis TaxID=574376 RepID=UPI003514CCE9